MPPTPFFSNYKRLCTATTKRRGRQGDTVLQSLSCNMCNFTVYRSEVLPGAGFARANRMHALMHNHIKANHPDEAAKVLKETA